MQAAKEKFDAQGVRIIVVSFAAPRSVLAYQQQQKWPFVLLSDPERLTYRHFGLERLPRYRIFSPGTIKLYLSLLLRGRKLQHYGSDDYYQGGGDFLIGREGRVLFAHQSRSPADRPSITTLLEEVRKARHPS